MRDGALSETVASLLAACGLAKGPVRLRAATGGGNNRVYFVDGSAVPVVAKKYFRSPYDQRDRLHAEWSFVNYAYTTGLRCVPRPIASEVNAQIALYEQVDGRKLKAREIGEHNVLAAADFLYALNEPTRRAKAGSLPRASEAGFSIAEHFALIDHRVGRLLDADDKADYDGEASGLIGELNAYWQELKASVVRQAQETSLPFAEALPAELRCVSPSDFGFHNALQRPDGRICFIDFEYAGWDDPAKTAADFFLQPEVPVDRKFFGAFMRAILKGPRADWQERRIALLWPVFALKWCCIMLNPFVAERAQPGAFANPACDESERKRTQLKKATAAFATLQTGEGAWRM